MGYLSSAPFVLFNIEPSNEAGNNDSNNIQKEDLLWGVATKQYEQLWSLQTKFQLEIGHFVTFYDCTDSSEWSIGQVRSVKDTSYNLTMFKFQKKMGLYDTLVHKKAVVVRDIEEHHIFYIYASTWNRKWSAEDEKMVNT